MSHETIATPFWGDMSPRWYLDTAYLYAKSDKSSFSHSGTMKLCFRVTASYLLKVANFNICHLQSKVHMTALKFCHDL